MELAFDLAQLAAKLESQTWAWDRRGAATVLKSLGFAKRQVVGHRVTFTDADGVVASVYHDDDRVERIELTAAAFVDVDELSDLEYEDKVDEFYNAFKEGTKKLKRSLGKPDFSDGGAARGFPDDQDAVWISLWRRPTCRLMFQQTHEDRELPFRLILVVAPPKAK